MSSRSSLPGFGARSRAIPAPTSSPTPKVPSVPARLPAVECLVSRPIIPSRSSLSRLRRSLKFIVFLLRLTFAARLRGLSATPPLAAFAAFAALAAERVGEHRDFVLQHGEHRQPDADPQPQRD